MYKQQPSVSGRSPSRAGMNYDSIGDVPKTIRIGITDVDCITALSGMGFPVPEKSTKQGNDTAFNSASWKGIPVKYCQLNTKDVFYLLSEGYIDMAVCYNDTLNRGDKKNYALKPVAIQSQTPASVCLVGRPGQDPMDINNVVFTEYKDAIGFKNGFNRLRGKLRGKLVVSHGGSGPESAVVNGIANFAIVVVQNAQVPHGLHVYQTIYDIQPTVWVNTNRLGGFYIYRSVVLPPSRHVIYIDGMSGTGKDAVIGQLLQKKELKDYIFVNRSALSEWTRRYQLPSRDQRPGQTIVLDVHPKEAFKRIKAKAGNGSLESLRYFRYRYLELAAYYGLPVLSAHLPVRTVVEFITSMLLGTTSITWPPPSNQNGLQIKRQDESKKVYQLDDTKEIITFKESNKERLRMIRAVLHILALSGIRHQYQCVDVDNERIIAGNLNETSTPVKVVVKTRWDGTDKLRMSGLDQVCDRRGNSIVSQDLTYYRPYVRFDWAKNNAVGVPEGVVSRMMDVRTARRTASHVFSVLKRHFQDMNIELSEIGLSITRDGRTVFSEICQDSIITNDTWCLKWRKFADKVEEYVESTIVCRCTGGH